MSVIVNPAVYLGQPATTAAPQPAVAASQGVLVNPATYAGMRDQVAPKPPKLAHSWLADVLSPLDAAASIGTGMASQVVGGLAGLADLPIHALNKNAPNPAKLVQGIENQMTYEPRTAAGSAIKNAIGWPFQKLAEGGNWAGGKVTDMTGSPLAGALTTTAVQGLPMLLGGEGAPDELPSPDPVVGPEALAAREAGYKLTPTQAQAEHGAIGRTIESLSGSAKLERAVSRYNAGKLTRQIADQLGIKGPVTQAALDAAKAPHNAIYDQVSKLGEVPTDDDYRASIGSIQTPGGTSFAFDTPQEIERLKQGYGGMASFDAKDAVAKVRQLRRDASANIGAPYNPERQSLGFAQRQVAEALDNQLERHVANLSAQGNDVDPELIQKLRSARKSLAQINSAEQAFKAGGKLGFSAPNLAKQAERGVPLSGAMKQGAEAASQFPRAFQPLNKIRDGGPLSNLDLKMEGGIGAINLLAAMKAAPLLFTSPLIRGVLGSDMYQRAAFDTPKGPAFPALYGASRAFPFLQPQQKTPISTLLATQ